MSRIPEKLRVFVEERADGRCEYCRKPSGVSAFSHQIEHIIAVKHGGLTEPDNLALACAQCNGHKGSDIASYDDQTGNLTPLFNPRTQQWGDHFVAHLFKGSHRRAA